MSKITLSKNIEEFRSVFKYLITKTGRFAGLSRLYFVTNREEIYACTSHCVQQLNNIENEEVVGKKIGQLDFDVACMTTDNGIPTKTNYCAMDEIVYTVISVKDVPLCNTCYRVGEDLITPIADKEKFDKILHMIELLDWH